MKASSKFFNNNKCKYFPCHPVNNPKNFNCLFCYCPLYPLGENCGGNFSYNSKGSKDCSNCTLPHQKKGYENVQSKIDEVVKLVKKNVDDDQ